MRVLLDGNLPRKLGRLLSGHEGRTIHEEGWSNLSNGALLEHVRSDKPPKARVQRMSDGSGIWPLLGGGCHCSRDTLASIEAAGYAIERVDSFSLGPSWWITNPHVLGAARAPQ